MKNNNFKTLFQRFLSTKSVNGSLASLGLFILRVAVCAMMLTHGMNKLLHFSEISPHFNPIGLGVPLSLILVIFAEVFCAIAVLFGFLTRLAVIPLMITMCVAVHFHAGQPFAAKELALLYLVFYTTLLITGPGRYSIDRLLWK